jgi:hypothetical protein
MPPAERARLDQLDANATDITVGLAADVAVMRAGFDGETDRARAIDCSDRVAPAKCPRLEMMAASLAIGSELPGLLARWKPRIEGM